MSDVTEMSHSQLYVTWVDLQARIEACFRYPPEAGREPTDLADAIAMRNEIESVLRKRFKK